MPKKLVSPLIIAGHFDYVLRINLTPTARLTCANDGDKQVFSNGVFYVVWWFPKTDYNLEYVENKRNELLVHYEKLGVRGKKGYKSTKFKQISQ